MYEKNEGQISFLLPFEGQLNPNNRWVKLAQILPWEEIEEKYAKSFPSKRGAPAKSARMALGSLIIKEVLQLSDEDTVAAIAETPAMQYFLGLEKFIQGAPFNPSSLVHFRKRFGLEFLQEVNDLLTDKGRKQASKKKQKEKSNRKPPGGSGHSDLSDDPLPAARDDLVESGNLKDSPKQGKLILDATCAPADIRYPTDLSLLNEAREKSEGIIDTLYAHSMWKKKPRTYRQKARKQFLKLARKKKLSQKEIKKGIRRQLRYIRRDLGHIDRLLESVSLRVLNRQQYQDLLVIHEVFRQQSLLLESTSRSLSGRIVSISQPHVRPIVRGKASASTEFGAKLSASICSDGFVSLDRLDFNPFNEALDLRDQVEAYRRRTGFYPEAVLTDKIYRNRENHRWCKARGIRLSGPRLGRPPSSKMLRKEQKRQNRQDERERNAIEGKFGQAKRRFGLSRVMARLKETSESSIAISFVVMNLMKLLELFFLLIFRRCLLAYMLFQRKYKRVYGKLTVFITRLYKQESGFSIQCMKA
jgi:hypothetical protein